MLSPSDPLLQTSEETDSSPHEIRRMDAHVLEQHPVEAGQGSDMPSSATNSAEGRHGVPAKYKDSPYWAQYSRGTLPSTGAATCFCCGKMVGNNRLLCGSVHATGLRSYFPFICLIGPDWPCNTVTWGLVSVPSILFLIFVAPVLHIALVVVQALLMLVTFGSLALVSWSNPGILPAQSPEEAEDQRLQLMERGEFDHALCGHCNTWRSRGAIHCSANGVCVREYDHHCPWMGKAVAGNNLFFFYVFLYSMCTLLGVTGIGSLVWMMSGESAAIR